MSFIFSTHALHPEAEAMLKAAGELRIASSPDPETLLGEGRGAEILIVREREAAIQHLLDPLPVQHLPLRLCRLPFPEPRFNPAVVQGHGEGAAFPYDCGNWPGPNHVLAPACRAAGDGHNCNAGQV